MPAEVEVRRKPCEDCGATGRCPHCGGTGRLPDGGGCAECVEGQCLVCLGTGVGRDYYYRGRLTGGRANWWHWLLMGLAAVVPGVPLGMFLGATRPGDLQLLAMDAILVALGLGLVARGLRFWVEDRAVSRAIDEEVRGLVPRLR